MFKRTTAINKILAMKARKKVIQGGSSASKTFGILSILIDKACKAEGLEISVVSESIPHLKKGALKDFIKIMKMTGRWIESHYNATDRKYTFSNDSYIEFFSPEAVLGARRHILYVNEANNITYQDYHQLATRTEKDIYIDFNPASEFWVHTEVLKEENSELLVLDYRDNEALPSNVVEEFLIARKKADEEKKSGLPITSYWQNYCRVYIDGKIGNIQGLIFSNWNQVDDLPKDKEGNITAEFIGYGLDFGFTNDPTALIEVYKQSGELWINELIYESRLINSEIIAKMNNMPVFTYKEIIADSAEPKTIEEIRRAGFYITGAIKGQDSVRASISKLQQFKINVTKRSTNIIRELRSYKWRIDKDGKALNEPVDYDNHAIDALRYVALNKINNNIGVYNFG